MLTARLSLAGGSLTSPALVHYLSLLPVTAQPQAASACSNTYLQLVGLAPLHLRYIKHARSCARVHTQTNTPKHTQTHTQVYTNTKHPCALIESLANRAFLTVEVPAIFVKVYSRFSWPFKRQDGANFSTESNTRVNNNNNNNNKKTAVACKWQGWFVTLAHCYVFQSSYAIFII